MIKKLLLFFAISFVIQSYSQKITTSSYSLYGIGLQKFRGTVENRSMGGLRTYTDSIHMNLRNPASYGGENLGIIPFNNTGRPIKFSLGSSFSNINSKSDIGSNSTGSLSFDYLALAIPIKKGGFGFGLLPYTAVGYQAESRNSNNDLESQFTGEGGLNKVFFGAGYKVYKGLSLGVDLQYNFGNIQNNTVIFRYDEDQLIQGQSREISRSDLSGLNVNLGLFYKKNLDSTLHLISSITYTPKSDLVSKNQRVISVVSANAIGQQFQISSLASDLVSLNLSKTNITLPSRISFGAGVEKPRKWFLGAEATFSNTSDFSNVFNNNSALYENSYAYAIGGFYIPNYNSLKSYWKRIVYRVGIRQEKTGLNINGTSINEFGISFGLGLPVGEIQLLSNANLGFEFGQRGTTDNNLVQENFFNFNISLSLNDRWFQKRKFD